MSIVELICQVSKCPSSAGRNALQCGMAFAVGSIRYLARVSVDWIVPVQWTMKRYQLNQKFFSLGDTYSICDEEGAEKAVVRSQFFSIGKKLFLEDEKGNELLTIHQRLLSFGPCYEISIRGKQLAVVKKHLFTFFKCRFSVDVPGPDDLEATGSFLEHEYTFERGGEEIATVSKKWFSFGDSYGVEIKDGQDDILILASAIVIDLASHPES